MKHIRFFMLIVLLAALALPGCQQEPAVPENLSFPGTQWGMTPETLMNALMLKEEDCIPESFGEEYYITADGVLSAFGEKAKVTFQFADFQGAGEYRLYRITVLYPEATDMQAVRKELESTYGQPVPIDQIPETKRNTQEGYWDHVTYWYSNKSMGEMLTEEEYAAYLDAAANPEKYNPSGFSGEISDEKRQEWKADAEAQLDELGATFIAWSDDFRLAYPTELPNNDSFGTPNGLIFGARYVQIQQQAQAFLPEA